MSPVQTSPDLPPMTVSAIQAVTYLRPPLLPNLNHRARTADTKRLSPMPRGPCILLRPKAVAPAAQNNTCSNIQTPEVICLGWTGGATKADERIRGPAFQNLFLPKAAERAPHGEKLRSVSRNTQAADEQRSERHAYRPTSAVSESKGTPRIRLPRSETPCWLRLESPMRFASATQFTLYIHGRAGAHGFPVDSAAPFVTRPSVSAKRPVVRTGNAPRKGLSLRRRPKKCGACAV
jgi:hypothetical protein